MAAVALMVDVGSFSEPRSYQGLAHFLEHMIFMGSEKYPAENAFDAHIKKCGGSDNAQTDAEDTVFFFEVSEEHLDSSMDYFSALLKAPLMHKEAMTRERDAVESEFQQVLNDDEARRDQLLASLGTKSYPHSTFAWGNLVSLKKDTENADDQLYEAVHAFCKRHYSAHRMYVVVQARLPIEELEGLVIKHFSDVPSNGMDGMDISTYNFREAFVDDFHQQVFFMKPVQNVCKIEFTWVLPPTLKVSLISIQKSRQYGYVEIYCLQSFILNIDYYILINIYKHYFGFIVVYESIIDANRIASWHTYSDMRAKAVFVLTFVRSK